MINLCLSSICLLLLANIVTPIILQPKILSADRFPNEKNICKNDIPVGVDPNNQHFGVGSANGIICREKEYLKIETATYGIRFPAKFCPKQVGEIDPTNKACSETLETTKIVKTQCDGLRRCKIDNRVRFPENCPTEANLGLQIIYRCVGNIIKYRPFNGPNGGLGQRRPFSQSIARSFGNPF